MTETFEQLTKAAPGRFSNKTRDYDMAEVIKLSGSLVVEHTLARNGANKLWQLLQTEEYVNTLGAMTGNHMVCCNIKTKLAIDVVRGGGSKIG